MVSNNKCKQSNNRRNQHMQRKQSERKKNLIMLTMRMLVFVVFVSVGLSVLCNINERGSAKTTRSYSVQQHTVYSAVNRVNRKDARKRDKSNESQTRKPNGLFVKDVVLVSNKSLVHSVNNYGFTNKPIVVRVNIGGFDINAAKLIRSVEVSMKTYRVSRNGEKLVSNGMLKESTNFYYQSNPLAGFAVVPLNRETIYDFDTISIKVDTLYKNSRKNQENKQILSLKSLDEVNKNLVKSVSYVQKPVRFVNPKINFISTDGTALPHIVIVDYTEPIISVKYANSAAKHDKYYRTYMHARITINEANFAFLQYSHSDIPIAIIMADNKPFNITPDKFTNSSTEKNTWYTDVDFNKDAQWKAVYSVQDLSGNMSEPIKDEFVIDTTAPKVEVIGVRNSGSYAGKVEPEIIFKDSLLDSSSIKYSLRASKHTALAKPVVTQNDGNVCVKYGNLSRSTADDDFYTLQWSAQDLAGNSAQGNLSFSVNRGGSIYSFDSPTTSLNNHNVKSAPSVYIEEINPSGWRDAPTVSLIQDGHFKALDSKDFSVTTNRENGWYRRIYKIPAKNFQKNASYHVRVSSIDNAGHYSSNDNLVKSGATDAKSASLSFSVDSAAPTVSILNLKDNTSYQEEGEGRVLRMNAKDNMGLQSVKLSIDGKLVRQWSDKNASATSFSHTLKADDKKHNVKIEACDRAGNVTTSEYKNIAVSTIDKRDKKGKKGKKDKKEDEQKDKQKDKQDKNGEDNKSTDKKSTLKKNAAKKEAEKKDAAKKDANENSEIRTEESTKSADDGDSSDNQETNGSTDSEDDLVINEEPVSKSISAYQTHKKSALSSEVLIYAGIVVIAVVAALLGVGYYMKTRGR